jgi:hypothetical protein
MNTYNMSRKLLVRYIREALIEVKLARVPNQLVSPEETEESGNDDVETVENVNEFSGAGSIVGCSVPDDSGVDEFEYKD